MDQVEVVEARDNTNNNNIYVIQEQPQQQQRVILQDQQPIYYIAAQPQQSQQAFEVVEVRAQTQQSSNVNYISPASPPAESSLRVQQQPTSSYSAPQEIVEVRELPEYEANRYNNYV